MVFDDDGNSGLRAELRQPVQSIRSQLLLFFVTAFALPIFVLALKLKWSKWLQFAVGALAIWSIAAFLVVHFGLGINKAPAIPTESFLKSGAGKVLDMGAGTGRSSNEGAPQAKVNSMPVDD